MLWFSCFCTDHDQDVECCKTVSTVCLFERMFHLRDTWDYMIIVCEIVCYALFVDVACVYEPCWYVEVYNWKTISSYYEVWSYYVLDVNWECVLCDNHSFYKTVMMLDVDWRLSYVVNKHVLYACFMSDVTSYIM